MGAEEAPASLEPVDRSLGPSRADQVPDGPERQRPAGLRSGDAKTASRTCRGPTRVEAIAYQDGAPARGTGPHVASERRELTITPDRVTPRPELAGESAFEAFRFLSGGCQRFAFVEVRSKPQTVLCHDRGRVYSPSVLIKPFLCGLGRLTDVYPREARNVA